MKLRTRLAAAVSVAVMFTLFFCNMPDLQAKVTDDFTQLKQAWIYYETGRFSEALNIWLPLAKRGNADAQLNLGTLYDYGQGVSEDPETAVKWYKAAARGGNPAAQFNLGLLYAQGRGVPENPAEAARWYRKAADKGVAVAQFNLGLLYADENDLKAVWPTTAAADAHPGESGLNNRREAAVEWLYRAGLQYLKEQRAENARTALEAVEQIAPGHKRATQLRKRFGLSAEARGSIPLRPDQLSGASIGTGWPIAPGYVITNNHVVSGSNDVVLVTGNGERIPAKAVLLDEKNDIAFLSVTDSTCLPPALPLAGSPAETGASVFTIGFPRIDVLGTAPKLTGGMISAGTGPRNNPESYRTTVSIQPGNSGGPLLNMQGEVVGLVTSMLGVRNESTGKLNMLDNASCALKVDRIHGLLGNLPARGTVLASLPRNPDDLPMLENRIKPSVLMVIAR